jgi:hypothetical protein
MNRDLHFHLMCAPNLKAPVYFRNILLFLGMQVKGGQTTNKWELCQLWSDILINICLPASISLLYFSFFWEFVRKTTSKSNQDIVAILLLPLADRQISIDFFVCRYYSPNLDWKRLDSKNKKKFARMFTYVSVE